MRDAADLCTWRASTDRSAARCAITAVRVACHRAAGRSAPRCRLLDLSPRAARICGNLLLTRISAHLSLDSLCCAFVQQHILRVLGIKQGVSSNRAAVAHGAWRGFPAALWRHTLCIKTLAARSNAGKAA
jgi:hypothetical protein